MSECTSCGEKLDYRDAFCSKCGAVTRRGMPLFQKLGLGLGETAAELGKLASRFTEYVRDEANRKQVVIGGALLVLLLLVSTNNPLTRGVSSLFGGAEAAGPQFTVDGLPDFASYEDAYLSETAEYILTGNANVRNYPTSQNTQVIKTLASGTTVSARQVKAFDPTAQWYRLADGGYVWGGNLARPDGQSVGGAMFPSYLRGQWSSMDTCRGDSENLYVTISAQEIQFYESGGQLMRISHDYKERELYHLAMSGEGEAWDETFRFMLSNDSMTLTLFDEGGSRPMGTFHKPEGGCDHVTFDY
jgi:hypothetical protein